MKALHVRRLGLVEYADGLAAQKLLVEARARGLIPDTLLIIEHPRVITLGRGAKAANILAPREELRRQGFEIWATDRGGDVTYHGPGQIVGYPILDLKPDRKDVRKYVASVEELMIRVARDYGIDARRIAGRTGVWTERGKLGAIGVHISRWVTSHGFAFNVRTDLRDFAAIVPCGIQDASVASLESLLGKVPDPKSVEERFVARAGDVWESEVSELAVERQILTGTMKPGESLLQTAAREVSEETGFSGELRELIYSHSFALGDSGLPPLFAHETAFALQVFGEPKLSDEHVEFRWCTPQEAAALLPYAGLRRAVQLAVAGGRSAS